MTDQPPAAQPTQEPPHEERRGRPTRFTRAIAYAICLRLESGETLREICRDEDMPHESTVRRWALDNVGKNDTVEAEDPSYYAGFFTQYARAREIGYLCMADEIKEIADDGSNDWMEKEVRSGTIVVLNHEHVSRSKLRVDARIWALSKALPKIYGNKLDLNVTGGAPTRRIDPNALTEDQAQELYEQAIS